MIHSTDSVDYLSSHENRVMNAMFEFDLIFDYLIS